MKNRVFIEKKKSVLKITFWWIGGNHRVLFEKSVAHHFPESKRYWCLVDGNRLSKMCHLYLKVMLSSLAIMIHFLLIFVKVVSEYNWLLFFQHFLAHLHTRKSTASTFTVVLPADDFIVSLFQGFSFWIKVDALEKSMVYAANQSELKLQFIECFSMIIKTIHEKLFAFNSLIGKIFFHFMDIWIILKKYFTLERHVFVALSQIFW